MCKNVELSGTAEVWCKGLTVTIIIIYQHLQLSDNIIRNTS